MAWTLRSGTQQPTPGCLKLAGTQVCDRHAAQVEAHYDGSNAVDMLL